MLIYAIRERATGFYLPMPKSGRGHSHMEPALHGGMYGPRFFSRRSAAVRALRAWVEGAWMIKVWIDSQGDEQSNLEPYSVAGRDILKMEVVTFNLIEIPS